VNDQAVLILHGLILAILLATFLCLGLNLLVFRTLRPGLTPVSHGPVSILIPARDEERNIGGCFGSLIRQDYPDYEVLVLDDNSTDRTAEIVRGLGAGNPRYRLITGQPLPEGWTGKNWACHQLSQAATGDWLVFTDADTIHAPGAITAIVAQAANERADLLSAWPRLVTVTLGEKLIIPVLHVVALGWFPIAFARLLQAFPRFAALLPEKMVRACGGANGQCILFRRAAYDRIGGHAAVRDHIVEDVALGREVARRIPAGMCLRNCDAHPIMDCRMYRSFREVCDGFTKNAHASFEGNIFLWVMVGGLQFIVFFLPFILLLIPSQFHFALVEVALIYLYRVILTLRMRTTWTGCILHPIGHFLAMAIGIRSWINTSGAGVQWKGRTYHPSFPQA
jgi:chlorobactene glucosyltransferase